MKFINHACIELDYGDGTLLTDPWFFGRVFNNAWELIVEGGDYDAGKLRYIWISHEHPDHLHFPTLRRIRESTPQPITVLFREQSDKNVIKAIAALGYDVLQLQPGRRTALTPQIAVTCIAIRSDSALLIEANGQRILNQNDCRLPTALLRKLRPVDLWLYQFSIAGHSGNEGDEKALRAAGDRHLEVLKSYAAALKPRAFVPFASFIRFSHVRNCFMNAWRVTPARVRALGLQCDVAVLAPGQRLGSPDATQWWQDAFKRENNPVNPAEATTDEELLKTGARFARTIARDWPRLALPGAMSIDLGDRYATLSLRAGEFKLSTTPVGRVIAALDRGSLAFLMRFPWGADTIHIAGTATVLDEFHWRWLLYIKHADYKLAHWGIFRTMVPLPAALLRLLR